MPQLRRRVPRRVPGRAAEALSMRRVGEIPSWVGTQVERRDGLPLGQVEAVHLEDRALSPTALLVRLTDGSRTLIPLNGVARRPGAVRLL